MTDNKIIYQEKENEILDEMSNKLSNITYISKETNDEIKLQNILIESLNNDVTNAKDDLSHANNKIRKIHTNNNNKGKLFLIVLLIILIIILLILIFE